MEFDFNMNDFFKGIDKALKISKEGMQSAVLLAGEALRGDSTDIVPFDHGFNGGLASTASTSNPKNTASGVETEVSYNMVYAVKLHEDMSLIIKQTNTQNGQVRSQKYLEKPMRENAQKYGKIMANSISKALNGR